MVPRPSGKNTEGLLAAKDKSRGKGHKNKRDDGSSQMKDATSLDERLHEYAHCISNEVYLYMVYVYIHKRKLTK